MTARVSPLLFALAMALFLAGSALAQGSRKPEAVTLQLKWKHQFQFAGYYAAQEKGYYREAGFEVRIEEPKDGDDPVNAVLSGRAHYGVASSELALRRGQGEPVVALAAILQHSPLVLLVRDGTQGVEALAGKRVMLLPYETELYAFFARQGLGRERIVQVPHSFNVDDLVKGKVDAISAYSTDETWVLRSMGVPFAMLTPRSAGIDFYGDTLFTTEARVKASRERVEAFRAASLKGWRYAMAHPEEIADLILEKYGKRHSRAHLLYEAAEMRALMQSDLVEIGHMNPLRWRQIGQVYADLGMLPREHSLAGLAFEPHPRPEAPKVDAWLAAALAALLLIAAFAAWQVRQNRAMRREMASRAETERQLRQAHAELRQRLEEIRVLERKLEQPRG